MQITMEISDPDMKKTCRLCGATEAVYIDIFSDEGKLRKLKMKLETCLPLKTLDISDPRVICYRCLYIIENFYDFYNQVLKFNTLLLNSSSEMISCDSKFITDNAYSPQNIRKIDKNTITDNLSNSSNSNSDNYENKILIDQCTLTDPLECHICKTVVSLQDKYFNFTNDLLMFQKHLSSCNRLVDYDVDSRSSFGDENDLRLNNDIRDHSIKSIETDTYSNIINEITLRKDTQSKKRSIDTIFNAFSAKKAKLNNNSNSNNDINGNVSNVTTDSSVSRRKNKQPRKLNEIYYSNIKNVEEPISNDNNMSSADINSVPSEQTCLLCELKFENHDLFVKHLYECHELEPKEIFDPKAIMRNSASPNYSRELSNLMRITDTYQNQSRTQSRDDSSDSEERFMDQNRYAPPVVAVGVQFDFESLNEGLWIERQYFTDTSQILFKNMNNFRRSFVCQICARDFNDKASIWSHLRATHPKHASLACGICLQLCLSWEQLIQHTQTEHNPNKLTLAEIRKYFCAICWRQHDSKKKLLNHVYVHDFLVDAYNKNGLYFDPEQFIRSNFIPSEDGPDYDKNEVESISSERNMLPRLSKNNGIGYNELLYSQLTDENMEQDIEEVSLNGDYDDINEQKQNQNGNTNLEENDVESSSIQKTPRNYTLTYGCEWCSRTLSSKWDRWLHVAAAHAPHIEALRCSFPHCDKVFVTEAFRNEHEQHHQIQGPVPNSCEVCCKLWNTRVDFYKHMMGVHPNAVPLVCGVCLKIFPTVPNLYDHVQSTHLPLQGDFVCNICGRNYSNKSKMVRHRRIHGVNDAGIFIPNFIQTTQRRCTPRRLKDNQQTKPLSDSNQILRINNNNKQYENVSLRLNYDASNQSMRESDSENDNYDKMNDQNNIGSGSMYGDSISPISKLENLVCKECSELRFATYDDFSTHKRVVHQTFHCDLCTKSYGRNSHLWKHVNRCHKGNKLITCQLCFKTSASKYHLQQHFNKIHALKTDRLKNNNSPQTLESFLDKKIDGYSFESVKQSFLRQEILDKQRMKYQSQLENTKPSIEEGADLMNADLKNDTTKQPPKEIDVNSDLYTSIITNYNPPAANGPYKCLKCNKGFSKRYLLKKHKKNCRPRLQKDLLTRCKSCERIFKDRQSLQKHLANYHSEFKCHLCMVTFPSKCEIISHIRFTHQNHPDFVCECNQILRSKSDLLAHKMDHRNSHICQFCGDSLLSKMKLKMHILSLHRKILSLSCGICLKLFASQHILRDHVKLVHFRDMKFGNCCSVCGKKYGSKWKCFDHINKSHGKIFKPCKICLSVFENEQEVREHFCSVHLGGNNSAQHQVEEKIPKLPTKVIENTLVEEYHSSDNEEDDNDQQSDSDIEQTNTSNYLPSIPKITLASNKNQPDNYTIVQKSSPDNNWQLIKPKQEVSESSNFVRTPSQTKRTVYENSDAPSMCEICLKTWPAKKHLWQHYIRCHKAAAATICGICLKTHNTYLDLRKHLHEKHPTLLHGRGFSSNFICKICGRYHNASSKLKLHMVIHVNYNLPDDYDYSTNFYAAEVKQELIDETNNVPSDHKNSDSDDESYHEHELEETLPQQWKKIPSNKKQTPVAPVDLDEVEPFLGFTSQQRKNSENYYRNYSSLLDCFQIMETSPPKNITEPSDLEETDEEDEIKSEASADCDSEDERRKLLLKMSPISIKSAKSFDNVNDEEINELEDSEIEVEEDEDTEEEEVNECYEDNDNVIEKVNKLEKSDENIKIEENDNSNQYYEEHEKESDILNDIECDDENSKIDSNNDELDDKVVDGEEDDFESDKEDSSNEFSDEEDKESEGTKFNKYNVKQSSDVIVLKYEDGQEVHLNDYENMEYEIVQDDEEVVEHEESEEIAYQVYEQHANSGSNQQQVIYENGENTKEIRSCDPVIENAIKSIRYNNEDGTDGHIFLDEHQEIEHESDDVMMIEEEVVTEDYDPCSSFSY